MSEVGQKERGLLSKGYCDWISKDISLDDELNFIYENYLIGTPSCGLSKKGRNLFEFYCYRKIESYSELLSSIEENIDECIYCETYHELGEKLLGHKRIGFTDVPEHITEVICIHVGKLENDNLYKEYFAKSIEFNNKVNNKKKKEQAEQRKKIGYADKIFYHIRNSLAHGSYKIVDKNDSRLYIFQDENITHEISARMILAHSTLVKWIGILEGNRESNINLTRDS